MAEKLLTPNQAAEKLGISRSTMYHWAYERRIPCVRLFGSTLRFRESDLEKLIAKSVTDARPTLREKQVA